MFEYFCGMFPASPHLTLVTIILLYWWESGSAGRLVICPRTRRLANMAARIWLHHSWQWYPRPAAVSQAWRWRLGQAGRAAGQQGGREVCDSFVCWAAQQGVSHCRKQCQEASFFWQSSSPACNFPSYRLGQKLAASLKYGKNYCRIHTCLFIVMAHISPNRRQSAESGVKRCCKALCWNWCCGRGPHQQFLFLSVERPVESNSFDLREFQTVQNRSVQRGKILKSHLRGCLHLPPVGVSKAGQESGQTWQSLSQTRQWSLLPPERGRALSICIIVMSLHLGSSED